MEKTVEIIANHICEWCVFEYGKSKHREVVPCIEIDPDLDCAGEFYDDNAIAINPNLILDLCDLIETIIHEYHHYLQSPAWFTRYYTMGYDHDTHPYEIAAETVARKDCLTCAGWLDHCFDITVLP